MKLSTSFCNFALLLSILSLSCGKSNLQSIPEPLPNGNVDPKKNFSIENLQPMSLEVGSTMVARFETKNLNEFFSGAIFPTLAFSTGNSSIATVDSVGNVKGISVGKTTITVKVKDTEKGMTREVVVVATAPKSIALSVDKDTLKIGEKINVKTTIEPSGADNIKAEDIQWVSSDPNVLIVSNGEVTARGVGSATITASIGSFNITSEPIKFEVSKNIVYGQIGKEVIAPNGLKITLQSVTKSSDSDSKDNITINYIVKNDVPNSEIHEGQWLLIIDSKNKGYVSQTGAFNNLHTGESRTRSYTFSADKNTKLLYFQYLFSTHLTSGTDVRFLID